MVTCPKKNIQKKIAEKGKKKGAGNTAQCQDVGEDVVVWHLP